VCACVRVLCVCVRARVRGVGGSPIKSDPRLLSAARQSPLPPSPGCTRSNTQFPSIPRSRLSLSLSPPPQPSPNQVTNNDNITYASIYTELGVPTVIADASAAAYTLSSRSISRSVETVTWASENCACGWDGCHSFVNPAVHHDACKAVQTSDLSKVVQELVRCFVFLKQEFCAR
jgi:hypothetical protein